MRAEELTESTIHVKGKIQRVTFKEPNYQEGTGGFAIFHMFCDSIEGDIPDEFYDEKHLDGRLLTFTGKTPSLKSRVEYEIMAELIKHERYGWQYKIIRMVEFVSFDSSEDIEKFFAYVFPEETARRIMSTLDNPIDVLEREDMQALMRVPGVGAVRAAKIIEKYKDARLDSKAYVALYDFGLTKLMIQKLCNIYGSPEVAIKKIQDDPYSLIFEVKGVGWAKADAIALNGGMATNDKRRVKAYVFYLLLKDAEENGNTHMGVDELIDYVKDEIPDVVLRDIGTVLLELVEEGKLFIEKTTRRIGLSEYRELELAIAKELHRIAKAPVRHVNNIDQIVADCEAETGYTYSTEQREAIYNCLTQNVSILTALAGSGKTTCMHPVSKAMLENNYYVALCALSGKASLNLGEVTGLEGSTIHRLLGFSIEDDGFLHNRENPLLYDMVILDEASMVDENIFYSLLKAIPNGCKLVLVGDTGQLEPIGVGRVFHDIIESKCFAHVHLTKIFRQAQKSGVITESRRVYDQIPITKPGFYGTEVRGELQDFKIITVNDMSTVLVKTIDEYKRFIRDYNADPDDITIVVGKRAIGETSARAINECVQKIVNGKETPFDYTIKKKDGNTQYNITFRPGDKVRVTRNCYDTFDLEGKKKPVFNGNIGKILEIAPEDGFMIVEFMQGQLILPAEQFFDLELGYAITCHSAQGSGFPYVITVCDNGSFTLLSKEWLYTAITRCKKYNTLVGQPSAIRRACSINGINEKHTWLKQLIRELFGLGEVEDDNI